MHMYKDTTVANTIQITISITRVPRSPWKFVENVYFGLENFIAQLDGSQVNFFYIAIQLITYLHLDGQITTAILERSSKSPWKTTANVLGSPWILKPQKRGTLYYGGYGL